MRTLAAHCDHIAAFVRAQADEVTELMAIYEPPINAMFLAHQNKCTRSVGKTRGRLWRIMLPLIMYSLLDKRLEGNQPTNSLGAAAPRRCGAQSTTVLDHIVSVHDAICDSPGS